MFQKVTAGSRSRAGKVSFPFTLLQKGFWLCVLAAGLVMASGCRTSRPPSSLPHQQIRQIVDAVVAVRVAEPDLVGFKDHEVIASNAFRGRSREDANLLLGRLYYDALQRLQPAGAVKPAASDYGGRLREAVRGELAKPRPVERFGRGYFDNILDDTKARAERDQTFSMAIRNATGWAAYPWKPAWDSYRCVVDGIPMPSFYCRFLVVNDLFETLEVVDF